MPLERHSGIVIDAGSSGTRLRVFTWVESAHKHGGLPRIRENPTAHVPPFSACLRQRPGLSAFARNPELAGKQMASLINCAIALVPLHARAATPLYVRATAGLRLLPAGQAEAVLDSVRGMLTSDACPFAFAGARMISGYEEAVFGWLSINHILGGLDGDSSEARQRRVGWLDLGGASAQVSWPHEVADDRSASKGGLAEVTQMLLLPAGPLPLYRESHLRAGREEAFRRSCRQLLRARGTARAHRRRQQQMDVEEGEAVMAGRGAPVRLEHPCLVQGDSITMRLSIASSSAAGRAPSPPRAPRSAAT